MLTPAITVPFKFSKESNIWLNNLIPPEIVLQKMIDEVLTMNKTKKINKCMI